MSSFIGEYNVVLKTLFNLIDCNIFLPLAIKSYNFTTLRSHKLMYANDLTEEIESMKSSHTNILSQQSTINRYVQ